MAIQNQALLAALADEAGRPPETLAELLADVPGPEAAQLAALSEARVLPLSAAYRIWAQVLGLPFCALDLRSLDASTMRKIPLDVTRRFAAVAVLEEDGILSVAMQNPFDIMAVDAIQEITAMPVQVMLATPESIEKAIERLERGLGGIEGLLSRIRDSAVDFSSVSDADKLREVVGDDAVVQLVDFLVEEGLRAGASDIHVEPQRECLRVRIRVDGDLETTHSLPKGLHRAVVARIKVIGGMDIGESRKPQDGRFAVDEQVEMRVSVLPSVLGEKAVLRVLNRGSVDLDPKRLCMSDANLQVFRRGYESPNGIVLVTGPTGSGKTTTLYTAMSELNRPDSNLVTVEDPVEYEMPGATQVQVDVKADRTFANALRSILRQDPDVVMIGEIRDEETAAIAVQAALTGHVVLSTLHTNNAIASIHRLIDMGVAPYLLGPALRCIVAQRLVPRVCEECAEPDTASPRTLREFGLPEGAPVEGLRKGKGCRACRMKGKKGRLAIHEVLPVTPELARMIGQNADEQALEPVAVRAGYRRMLLDGLDKAMQGLVTLEDVLAVARAD
ncbi:MAG: hypothetical protein Fur0037_14770 [Planctomycetota bacterium]